MKLDLNEPGAYRCWYNNNKLNSDLLLEKQAF